MSDLNTLAEETRALVQCIRKLSYREGDFVLASGQKSKFYVDLKATTLHPEGAYLIGRLTVRKIQEAGLQIDAVGGMSIGSDPIGTAVSLAARAEGLLWPAYIVRKDAKDHGTARYVEGTENFRIGARLLIVEDVCTTGGSSLKAIDRLRDAGYHPVAVLTVVDRRQGAEEAFTRKGLRFLSLATIGDILKLAP